MNTTIILGAGSSCEYGFPLGLKLVQDIIDGASSKATTLAQGSPLHPEVRFEVDLQTRFADKLRLARPQSIDSFLSEHPEFQKVGKKIIFEKILNYEANSTFRLFQEDYCYTKILNAVRKSKIDDLQKVKLKIITFNYDRSLSHFLKVRLDASYLNPGEKVSEFITNSLETVHVYGRIGALPWEESQEPKVHYGEDMNQSRVHGHVENLKLIGESRTEDSSLRKAIDHILWADRIIFLGFGYLRENLEILDFLNISKGKQIFGTGFDLSDPEMVDVAKRIGRTPSHEAAHVFMVFGNRSYTCNSFLKETVLLEV